MEISSVLRRGGSINGRGFSQAPQCGRVEAAFRARSVVSILTIALLVGVSGCATSTSTPEGTTTVSEAKFSGFLEDYSRLEPVPGETGTLLWIKPDFDLSKYDKIMVDRVVTKLSPERITQGEPDPETIRTTAKYLREATRRELGTVLAITDEPGKGVLWARMAITGAQVSRQELSAANYVPIALVMTGAREATGARDRVAYVYMEGHLTDSLTGVTVMETVQSGIGRVSGATDTSTLKKEQIQAILDFWAAKFRERVADAQ